VLWGFSEIMVYVPISLALQALVCLLISVVFSILAVWPPYDALEGNMMAFVLGQ
jgi:hypothetical protein